MDVAETFKALGDPIRLMILQRLSDGSPRSLGALLHGLGLTRQGARKHLQVLTNADLVLLESAGRSTEAKLNAAAFATAKSFITDLEQCWDHRLQALREYVEDEITMNRPH